VPGSRRTRRLLDSVTAAAFCDAEDQETPVRHDDGVARNAIGTVVPTIEAATGIGWQAGGTTAQETKQSSTIAVFATRRTVDTGCHTIEIRKRRPDITVVQQA